MKLRIIILLLLIMPPTQTMAVEMSLTSLDGKSVNIDSFRGQWLVVNYWATWCPPCIEEMPELQAFHDDHIDTNARVIGINAEFISREALNSFLDSFFISYPIYLSKPSSESPLGLIPGLPTTFLISPQGETVARQVGPITAEMLEKFIANWDENKQAGVFAEEGAEKRLEIGDEEHSEH